MLSESDLTYSPPDDVLKWADENESSDSLAKAFQGICYAIYAIEADAVTDSRLLSLKKESEDESMDDALFSASDDLEECLDRLFLTRNKLARLIGELLKM